MKAPKTKRSRIKDALQLKVVPPKLTKVEFALHDTSVTLRFNGRQTVSFPQSVIEEIYNKIKEL